jgi:hypothetical protein
MKYKKHQDEEWTKINSFDEMKIEPDVLYLIRTEGSSKDHWLTCQDGIKERFILSRTMLYDEWKTTGSIADGTYERDLLDCGIEIEFHAIAGSYIFVCRDQAKKTITCEEMYNQDWATEDWWKSCENLSSRADLFYAEGRIYWKPPKKYDNCGRCHKPGSPLVINPYDNDMYDVRIWENLCEKCKQDYADDI